jgi:hypothetical protein
MFASRQATGPSSRAENLPIYISWYINDYGSGGWEFESLPGAPYLTSENAIERQWGQLVSTAYTSFGTTPDRGGLGPHVGRPGFSPPSSSPSRCARRSASPFTVVRQATTALDTHPCRRSWTRTGRRPAASVNVRNIRLTVRGSIGVPCRVVNTSSVATHRAPAASRLVFCVPDALAELPRKCRQRNRP